ncbi:MAG: two-component regulator propeller domain-containing protein, partial [Bacteroidales bacterium]
MLRKLFNLVFFFLLSLPLSAEYKTNVHSISRREGLSNGAVNTIVKDAEGYIWFGTWNGLNRYDGSNIVTYLPGTHPNSIHNHVIRELYPTSAGPIWMLTNKGLALYDNIHDRFTSYFTRESEQINYENDIAISHSDPNGTLASVFGRGIFQYDPATSQFKEIVFDSLSKPSSLSIKRIHLVDNIAYCITGSGQLMMISGSRLEEILQLPLTGTLTSSISVFINRRPCILITQRTGAALMVDLETKEVQQLSIPDDIITAFALSQEKNRLWAGTEKGRLYSFNLTNRNFEVLNRLSGLFINNPIATRILSIYESEPDILWIGTDGNGVYTLKLTEFPNKSLSSAQLAYPIVRSILVSGKGDVLIGTKGGGIDVFDANGNHIREISVKDGLSNNSVLSFHERDDGSIWVGTDGKGVDIISPDYKIIRNFPRDLKSSNRLNFASVYRILEDSDQHIYLGTSGYGVIMVEFDKKDVSLPINSEQLILDKSIDATRHQNQIVYALAEEKPGVIWIGTRGVGVYRYNTITKRVIAQYSTSSHPDLIRNDDILSLFTELNGTIWVGSSNGIFSLLPISSDSVRVAGLSIQPDLSNTSIHAIQLDKPGNLWVTTNLGLSLIDIGRGNVRSFNVNDGLINFEYSDGASFFDKKSGRLYVGGTMGVDIILTDEIKFSSYFPPIAINQFFIRNLPVEPGSESVLTSRINHQKILRLKYNQNSISFNVSPLAYWGQERHRISYRLINFDDEWIINPQNQHISFSNLSPGKYSLEIRVSDENGNWSKNIREIEIIINPPFWWTLWAIAGYILLFIGAQLLIFAAYRRREARKKEAVLQEFQKKKEEELQSYKIEFFTNVAHEFRTPLTLITSHIHALLEDTRNTVENPRLLKVFNNSIKLQKLVLEIMQFRKLEKGKEPLNIQLTKPVELISEVVSDLELFAQERNIHCEVIASDPQLCFKTDADKFQRIVTNLISNAIKYNKTGGFVKASVKSDQSALIIEIEDNGVGIKPEYFQKVFEPFGISSARKKGSFPGYRSTGLGLAVTKGLVELMKG